MASLRDAISSMEKSVDGLIQRITSASQTMAGPGGRINTGSNFLNNGLGAFSTNPSVKYQSQFNLGMGMVRGTGQMMSGMGQMMPAVSATMDRMATGYGATLRIGGGMSRNQLQQQILAGLNGGITGPGSDQYVAQVMAMRGVSASSPTFGQVVSGVGNAAKYLNMSNERATTALTDLTGANMASSLLRIGVFTADPRTGKTKTQGQIFGDIYSRLTAGRATPTEQQVLDSYRRGTLGIQLNAMGMSQDQQSMFVQYAIERSRGNNMDLSDPEAMQQLMDKAAAEGNENPNLPGYEMNTAQTGAMQNAQDAYLAGIKAVTPVLRELTEVGGELASVFGGLKSAAGSLGGNSVLGGFGQALSGGGQLAAGMALYGLAKGGKGKGLVTKAFQGAKGLLGGGGSGQGLSTAAGKVASRAIPGLGAAVAGGVGFSEAASGEEFSIGNLLTSVGGGAVAGGLIGGGVPGAIIGGLVGGASYVGGRVLGGMFGEGGDDGDSNTNGTGAPQQFKLIHPTKSAEIAARFGRRESFYTPGKITWPNGHKGIDYVGKKGDSIFASAGGYATLHSGGELGNRVRIKHANGMYTHYCHLDSIIVREGEVKVGQPIGRMGNTGGKSTGVHLHFALTTGPDTSSAIDPEPYLSGGGNYLSSPPQDAEQSPSSTAPASAGSLSGATNPGGEDSSPVSATANTNRSSGTAQNVPTAPGGQGSSAADGVEAWSQSSMYGGASGANTAAAPEGGENTSDQPGYLPTAGTRTPSAKTRGNGGTTNNTVTINLSIEKATPDEARKFSYMLKQALEDDKALMMMARN